MRPAINEWRPKKIFLREISRVCTTTYNILLRFLVMLVKRGYMALVIVNLVGKFRGQNMAPTCCRIWKCDKEVHFLEWKIANGFFHTLQCTQHLV